MPADTNPAGDIFGGWLMWQMDLAAGSLATRLARGRCATVAVDAMEFISPVFVGDEVSFFASLKETGRTSLRISVEAWRRSRDSEETNKVTSAIFAFVAIDNDRKPRPLNLRKSKTAPKRSCPRTHKAVILTNESQHSQSPRDA